jgi:hypothetical protein
MRATLRRLVAVDTRMIAVISDPTPVRSVEHVKKQDRSTKSMDHDVRELKVHSKSKTPVAKVAKALKRTEAALRQKAKTIGVGLGHRR